MSDDLRLKATVEVDNRTAIAPLAATKQAVAGAAGALDAAKASATSAGAAMAQAATGAAALGAAGRTAAGSAQAQATATGAAGAAARTQAAGMAAAAAEAGRLDGAQKQAARSAGAMRAASQNLGFQISDISTGLAAGTSAFTIFGQQAGQVAQAVSGFGGVAGAVGTFLSGPFGAILIGLVAILGTVASRFLDSGDAAKRAAAGAGAHEGAARTLADAIKDLDGASGRGNRTTEEAIRIGVAETTSLLNREIATRKLTKAKLESVLADQRALAVQQTAPGTRGELATLGRSANAGVVAGLEAQVTAQDASVAAAQAALRGAQYARTLSDVKAATDAAARANRDYERTQTALQRSFAAGKIGAGQLQAELLAAERRKRAALDASKDDARVARAGDAAAKRDEGAAARAAKAAAAREASLATAIAQLEEQATIVESGAAASEAQLELLELQKTAGRALTAIERDRVTAAVELKGLYASVVEAQRVSAGLNPKSIAAMARAADEARLLQGNPLDGIVAGIDARRDLKRAGRDIGHGFEDAGLTAATAIGQAIGGKAGGVIATLFAAFQGARSGNFTGLGGQAGGLLTLAGRGGGTTRAGAGSAVDKFTGAFTETFAAPFKRIADKFDTFFGSGGKSFAGTAGKAFAGAAQGQIAGSVVSALGVKSSNTGAQLGGAIGALIPALGPFGGLIGGAIGGLVGGLFKKKAKTGGATISSTTGAATTSGNSASRIAAAEDLAGRVQSGIEQIAQQLGGTIGSFTPVTIGTYKDKYRVNTQGTKLGGSSSPVPGLTDFGKGEAGAAAAVAAAIGDAIRSGAITGLSPRVQAVIKQYGDDLDTAVAEALKVASLEDLLANDANPFATAFRALEQQNAARLATARKYGFDVAQIERINGEQRAAAIRDTLDQATSSVKAALDDLRFGSRATGSLSEQRASLTAERDRLTGLVAGGDTGQLGALTSIVQQLVDLDKSASGSTGAYAASRDAAISLLDGLVKQTEDKINAAAQAAQTAAATAADPTVAKLAELNATGDDQVALAQQQLAQLTQVNASLSALVGARGTTLASLYARSPLA